ncbi:MAG: hypothetical protein IPF41_17380 [Flavobacteriales bacterium]|nr:hypothetical protein [Flavobacteriales bacterium]
MAAGHAHIAEGGVEQVAGPRHLRDGNKEGVVRYCEVAPELGAEPDYDAALNAAKALL